MAGRTYRRDARGRFAGKSGGYGPSTADVKFQRVSRISTRVARTATRADEAAMGRVSKAFKAFQANPSAKNKSAWVKAGAERNATWVKSAKIKGRARKAAERKLGLR